jgi:hypothetical protein
MRSVGHRARGGRAAAWISASFALAALAGVARADGPTRPIPDALVVDRGQGATCVDRAAIAAQLARWLGRGELDSRVSIAVRETSDGVTYTVRRDGSDVGERRLAVAGASCAEVQAAVALAIAVAIDATVLDALGVRASAPSAPTAAAPSPPAPGVTGPFAPGGLGPPIPHVPSARLVVPPRPKGEAPRVLGSAQGVVLLGVLPEVALGIAPSVDVELASAFDLRASALATTSVSVEIAEGTADVGLIAGRLDACAALRAGVARLRGCAGVAAGAVQAEGSGYHDTYAQTVGWVAPVVRFDARWGFGRAFGLVLSADGFLPGLKPRLDVLRTDGSVRASRAFPLAGVTVGLGPSVAFW